MRLAQGGACGAASGAALCWAASLARWLTQPRRLFCCDPRPLRPCRRAKHRRAWHSALLRRGNCVPGAGGRPAVAHQGAWGSCRRAGWRPAAGASCALRCQADRERSAPFSAAWHPRDTLPRRLDARATPGERLLTMRVAHAVAATVAATTLLRSLAPLTAVLRLAVLSPRVCCAVCRAPHTIASPWINHTNRRGSCRA